MPPHPRIKSGVIPLILAFSRKGRRDKRAALCPLILAFSREGEKGQEAGVI